MASNWIMERRPRRQFTALALLALALAFVALVVQQPVAAALLALALVLVAGAAAAARPALPRRRRPAIADGEATPTLRLELASGEVVSARPVVLPNPGEEQLLLTRDGYIVVNREGRVIHRL